MFRHPVLFLLLASLPFVTSRSEEKETNEVKNKVDGVVVGSSYNVWNYAVETVGRKSNMVIVRDKSVVSSLGNYKSWVRLDAPHGKMNYYHLNVNPAVTGVPDPHTYIPQPIAVGAQSVGKAMEVLNKAAPVLLAVSAAYDTKQIYDEFQKDNTRGMAKVVTTAGKYVAGAQGSSIGASVGTWIMPGIGTLVGGIIGGIMGTTFAANVFEPIVDKFSTD